MGSLVYLFASFISMPVLPPAENRRKSAEMSSQPDWQSSLQSSRSTVRFAGSPHRNMPVIRPDVRANQTNAVVPERPASRFARFEPGCLGHVMYSFRRFAEYWRAQLFIRFASLLKPMAPGNSDHRNTTPELANARCSSRRRQTHRRTNA